MTSLKDLFLAVLMVFWFMCCSSTANARDIAANFGVVSTATAYTIYKVGQQGEVEQVAEGTEAPILFSIDDSITTAAFVVTASNSAGESGYSEPAYLSIPTQQEPIEVILPPNTPVMLNITIVSQ